MSTTTSGAVGFAPVGTFVNDLAKELCKSASTLVAYLKKHLPTTLSKRKNSNNRLANWVTSDGEAGLRAHYKPTYAPQPPSELELEVQRLRARVAELEAENASLKAEADVLELNKPMATASRKLKLAQRRTFELVVKSEVDLENDVRAGYGLPPITIEEYKETINGKFTYQETQSSARKNRTTDGSEQRAGETKSNVIGIGSRRKTIG